MTYTTKCILKHIGHSFGDYNMQDVNQIWQKNAFQIRYTIWSIIRYNLKFSGLGVHFLYFDHTKNYSLITHTCIYIYIHKDSRS